MYIYNEIYKRDKGTSTPRHLKSVQSRVMHNTLTLHRDIGHHLPQPKPRVREKSFNALCMTL